MANELGTLSEQIAAVVSGVEGSVVAVHARPRFASSGVFWRPGVVVTAAHSIRREDGITVTMAGGKSAPARLLGMDAGADVAVLGVEGGSPLPRAAGPPKPGNLALTVGRSKDSGVNATLGMISAVSGVAWRTWRGGHMDDYIRLDLTLYPQSSGAAVVTVAGEILGIATPALSRIAAVAIPAATVDRAVEQILAHGRVRRGYVGAGLQPADAPGGKKGLLVVSTEADGPAAKAGILVGDILLSLAGRPTTQTDDVQAALQAASVGQPVRAEILRGGVAQAVEIVIGERPQTAGPWWAQYWRGGCR